MKETVNVNIGSQAFTLDEDAYRVLRRRIAHTHSNTDPHTLRRPFDLGLHHPLADRAEGSEAINRIAQWPKTT